MLFLCENREKGKIRETKRKKKSRKVEMEQKIQVEGMITL